MKHFHKTVALLAAMVAVQVPGKLKAQNQAGLQGVDHVGMNVPDLPQAVHFFTDVLGFTPVTQIGPVALDSSWKQLNHMQPGTGPVTIRMTRAGDGSNIELFYYAQNKGSQQQPGADDIGASHIAFYTADIKASIAFLKSKGVTFLGEPFSVPGGDTEGETFVYFLAPWGAKLELVSYPHGKGYEKHNPAVRLWSPKDAATPAADDTLSQQQLRELAAKHLVLFNNTDAAARLAALGSLYTSDVAFVDPSYVSEGLEGLNTFIGRLQQQHPSFRFSLDRIDANHRTVRLYWNYGDKAHPALVKGMDLITVQNGKISALQAFLDAAGK